jgi:hypothetical protein
MALIMRAVGIPRERRLFAVPALRGAEGLPESLAVSIPAGHAIRRSAGRWYHERLAILGPLLLAVADLALRHGVFSGS